MNLNIFSIYHLFVYFISSLGKLSVSKIAVLLRGVPGSLDWMNTLLKWQIFSCHAHTKYLQVCWLPLSSAHTVWTSGVLHFYLVKSVSVYMISSISFKVRNRNQIFILAFCDFTFTVNLFFLTEIWLTYNITLVSGEQHDFIYVYVTKGSPVNSHQHTQ